MPSAQPTSTAYARLRPAAARCVLAMTLLACLASAAISLSPLRSGRADVPKQHAGDVALYRAAIERMQRGKGYYPSMAAEQTERGYPTRSVFNWRTPLPLGLLGNLPDPHWGKALLCILAGLAVGTGFVVLAREFGPGTGVFGGVLLAGAVMPCFLGDLYVMSEVWAGVLIGLSVACYGLEARRGGVAAGLAAMFVRELALPYALMCLLLAVVERRRREAIVWSLGLLAYAVFLAQHAAQVLALVEPTARAHDHGWVCLGGWAFLIALAQMNAFFLVLPQWVTAIVLPLAVLGWMGWSRGVGPRLTLAGVGYLLAFAIVGQPFNQYWGSLIAPLVAFGAAVAPRAVADLLRAAEFSATDRADTSIAPVR